MKIKKHYVAEDIPYDNDDSGLEACNVQEALDELHFDNIVTHQNFPNGNPLKLYDPVVGQYLSMDDMIVTDQSGNVVSA